VAPAEHEGVGDVDGRRKVDVGAALGHQAREARVEPRYSRSSSAWLGAPSTASARPPSDSAIRPSSVSMTMSHDCGLVWRQSNSAVTGRPATVRNARLAAIGAARFAGK